MTYYTESQPLTMDEVGEYLYHHGIKGQHWGVRRYQNPDGSLTPEGKQRYRSALADNMNKYAKRGAKIGAVAGGVGGAAIIGSMASIAAVPVATLAGLGVAYSGVMALAGAIDGVKIGAIVGAVKTGRGKTWAKKNLGVE